MTSSDSGETSPLSESDEPILAKLAHDDSAAAEPVGAEQTVDETVASVEAVASDDAGDQQDVEVRVGSPFAVDPPAPIAGTDIRRAPFKPEEFYDVGPLRYTAMGAVGAAVLVLGFALAAMWWFPGGGTVIAALGCALSIFGLYSPRRFTAGGCLAAHLLLFMLSYSRAIGT